MVWYQQNPTLPTSRCSTKNWLSPIITKPVFSAFTYLDSAVCRAIVEKVNAR